jgi:hydroxymethylpyrimidine pyrophosphatase-like HAD family hydrolase
MEKVDLPIQPDFVLTNEREVFRRTEDGKGWEDFGEWNRRCALAHDELYGQAEPLLFEIERHIEKEGLGRTVYIDTLLEGIVTESVEHMERAVAFIDGQRMHLPDLGYQRNTVYLRFCHADYHKGAALGELARLLELERGEVFAVGDNFNDLPMLQVDVAGRVACPGNAIDPVKEFVRDRGGHVAEEHFSAGVIAALRMLWPDLPAVDSAGKA